MSAADWWLEASDDPRTPEQRAKAAEKQREQIIRFAEQRRKDDALWGTITAAQAHDLWLEEMTRPITGAMTTGWDTIDTATGRPWLPGEVVLIAARTSVGKSFACQHLALRHLQRDEFARCQFYTFEMPEYEMAHRSYSSLAHVSPRRAETLARAGEVPPGAKVVESYPELSRLDYYPRSGIGTEGVANVIERAAEADRAPTFLVLDYIGLMGGRGANEYERASQRARELKAIAKSYHVLVIAAAQLNRSGGRDGTSEPSLDSMRDSGVIEEAADRVLGMWREDDDAEESRSDRIMVKYLKNRHGERNKVAATIEFDYSRRMREVSDTEIYGPAI